MDILERAEKGRLKVIVKPNAKRTELLGWDADHQALRIALAAPAEKNKANIELLKFLGKQTGKRVRILVGLSSKEKVVAFG